ncbi:MAG: NAD(P)H-dependent oxidoreductase [Desulfobacterales bacterium]|uniref:NAD(P)H-dependent oxidoreductase n=1 Tax=Candidatus Desulfatibia vada TaxID=2841696 RepID=A0A8J6P222_9BACT|nr:NAD(P)H-dependent oxidoreductase [Candidatus Desulfatibia vada]MBL6971633.1 NAD(P)H-dependent oxidoreductase [Desulfobacterales bacterium]
MKFIIKHLPFAGIIAINSLAIAGRYRLESLKSYVFIISAIILLNLIIAILIKVKSYFNYGISGIMILGAFSVFLAPSLGQIYLKNVITALYVGLFSVALFPPLFKLDPFTYEFSKKNYPEAITKTDQFRKINIIINYIWAALFGICIILSKITYSDDGGIQVILSSIIPIVLLLAVGIPINRKLPAILMQTTQGEQMHFESIKDLFEAMPFGLNKGLAEGLDTIIQFHLTGEEPTDGYLTIKNLECTYTGGTHPEPKTTIRADSKLWLAISNNEVSGDQAYINKEYTVDGDMTILLKLGDLFAPSSEAEEDVKQKPKEIDFEYKTFEPGRIKNIVVFDGGPRNTKFSKTTFMVNHFCRGAKSAGAEIEYIKLKDMKINPCTGCYTCWTKTPGECIFKDDMSDLRLKFRKADLIIFSSPLYIFSVTGIMKNFLDRNLPNMKPYMLIENGETKHPHRYPEDRQQGFVVFSAAGFPEVDHNFDGLKGMFRCLHSHSEKSFLMGEFYMPGAELISQPVYGERRKKIELACSNAGEQVVKEGEINMEFMEAVSDVEITQKKFQEQADYFWESLDGKASYLKRSPKLEYTGDI